MAILHITYQPDADKNNAACQGFCNVLESYQSMRFSKSNWAINTDEPPTAIWQKLKHHIKRHDYFVMFPLDVRLLSSEDKTILGWVLARP